MSGLQAAADALPFVTDLISMPFKIHESRANRRLDRDEMLRQEKQRQFQRLMTLMQAGQGMQSQNASAGRLMALRNSGGI